MILTQEQAEKISKWLERKIKQDAYYDCFPISEEYEKLKGKCFVMEVYSTKTFYNYCISKTIIWLQSDLGTISMILGLQKIGRFFELMEAVNNRHLEYTTKTINNELITSCLEVIKNG